MLEIEDLRKRQTNFVPEEHFLPCHGILIDSESDDHFLNG